MSSDSDHMPKPSKRIRCRISDTSESSSDESVIARIRRKRRNHMKVVSDDDSSEEELSPTGKKNTNKALESDSDSYSSASNYSAGSTSDEWESDWESESDEDMFESPKTKKRSRKDQQPKEDPPKSPENVESDESDGTSEKCPICFLSFRRQQIAVPSCCEHCFCLICLTEWSKNVNTCPVDRKTFTTMKVKENINGSVIKCISVEPKNATEEQVQEDPTFCEICHLSDREDRLLLCDGCDSGYHLECLVPPMDEVPYDNWYCPECSANDPNMAEEVNIETNEVSDLIAEARCLGMTYGRREAGLASQYMSANNFRPLQHRLVPRTRQTERVRASIRATRSRREPVPELVAVSRVFDPDQPSTSSGFDSISENSRGRSPNASSAGNFSQHSRRTASKSKSRSKPTSRKKKTPKRKKAKNNEPVLQKVVIKDYDTDGEEREIVSYVKVKSGTSSRKRKKRSKKTFKRRKNKYHRRACRRIGNIKSVRKRVAIALNMAKKKSTPNPIGLISLTNQSSSVPQGTEQLTNARYRAGIPQLNLFGNNLPLDYCLFGSDDEINPSVSEEDGISGGNVVSVTRRSASSITGLRRRLGLKNRVSRVRHEPHPQPVITDLLDNIISSQELWHSKHTRISLKADGTFSIPEKKNNKPDIVRNNDFLKDSDQQSKNDSIIASVTGSANINSADIVQAPMYNNSRGGNNSDGRSFRGNYHNRGHHGHNRNDYGPPRDSYSGNGPPTYGGPGPRDSFGHGDFRQPPPLLDFSPNRRQPHSPGMINRNRNNPNFRNNPRGRNFNNDRGGFRPLENLQNSNFQPPENFHSLNVSNINTGALPSNVSNLSLQDTTPENLTANVDATVENTSNSESAEVNPANESAVASSDQPEGEECDIYSDIDMSKPSDNPEGDNKGNDGDSSSIEALLPPPIPPSDLLDFEDNLKSDNESDDNDLVIDDTPKEPVKDADGKDCKTDDKYDPFAVIDSDSNDENNPRDVNSKKKSNQGESSLNLDSSVNSSTLPPLEPPPMPPDFSAIVDMSGEMKNIKKDSLTLLGTYYNDEDDDNANQDDDDDETKSDCPNFSIYSSETMDVARHAEQELTQQIGPLEPPPMPPLMPDDDDIIVADVQSCDLADIPEPSDPYIESLQKERQTLSKIPTKKLSIDSRGKITFKIGNKSKLNNKLCNLEDRFEDTVSASMDKDKDVKDKEKNKDLKDKDGKIDESKEKEVKSKDVKEKEDTDDKKKESSDKEDDKKSKEKEGENESKEKESQKFLVKTTDDADDIEKSNEDDDNSAAVVVVVVESKEDKEEEFEVIKIDSPEKEKDKDNIDELISENKNENEEIENAEIVEVQESICLSKSTSDLTEESDELKLRKDNVDGNVETKCTENEVWESDGAYTPCKDEMPVKESIKLDGTSEAAEASFDNGLEPITPPPKDRSTDDLGARCRTPIEYAGLGTEAISETDEPINFEEELTMLSQRKDKEIEDGEVSDENKLSSSGNNKKHKDKSSDTDNNPDSSRKKKKNRRDRNKEASEKNKENISSDNQVEWKKISKSTKERSYREKSKNYESGEKDKSKDKSKYRDKSKDRGKKHGKEDSDKKKVKRKELPRYDVRKIVSEKPVRPRKDEYGRDIRDLSLSLSPSRSLTRNRRSHSRLSRSYSPRMNLRKSRSWSRHRARSRECSQNRSSPYKQSLSHSRKKSPTRDRRSLSRRRSRSPTSRRNQRISPARQHQSRRSKKKSLSRKNRSRTRSWSRSRSRSPRVRSRSRVKSRSRSRLRMRSRSKSRTSSKSPSKTRSRSRGAKKKEKLRKQKSPSASHSRRRKRSRSRSKSPSKKTPKSLRTKRRAKRDSNVSQTNACHSFITRSRSRERSYSHARNWNKISDKDMDHSPFDVRGEKDQQVSGNAGVSWSAQWTPSWSRSRSRTPLAVNKQRDDHMMQSRNWSPTSSSIGDMIAAQSINLPPSSPPSQSSLLASMSNALGNINGANPSAPTQLDNHVSPKNLTVILRNKDATKSKKKKDKRSKDKKKSRDADRRKGASKRNRTPPPSKEVFASGDNILVSVCFNNDTAVGQSNNMMNLTDTLPLLTTTKRRRREPVQEEPAPPAKKPKKDKSKEKKSRPSPKVSKRDKKRKSKAAEIAATKKPVAVIDLDQSPFREQTLSPQDVIVLSDDDNVGNNDGNNLNNGNNGNNVGNEERGNINAMNSSHDNTINTSNNSEHNIISIDNNSSGVNNQNNDGYDDDDDDDDRDREDNSLFMFANQQQDGDNQGKGDDKVMQQEHQLKLLQQKRLKLSEHEQFMIQGPKTPPEPQIKFSISKQQSNLRSMIMHPLFNRDRDDELEMVEQLNANASRGKEGQVQNEIFDENDSSEINRLGQDQAADKNIEDEEDLGNEGKKGDGQVVDDDDGEQDDEEGEDEEEDRGDEEEQKGEKDRMDDSKKQDKDKRDDEDKSDKKAKNDAKNSEVIDLCKIGPNTPPEPPNSPLTSPDVYDPFDPTKSRSPTPSIIEEPHLPSEQKHPGKSSDLNTNNEKPESDKPKVISMVTIKRASPEKAAAPTTKPLDIRIENKSLDHLNQNSGGNLSCFTTINPVLATVAAAVQRSGIFNNPGNYSITQRNINRLSPSSQLKQRGNERPQLTNLFTGKNLGANSRLNKAMENRNSSMLTNNGGDLEGNDATIDTSSPYSPGSSLSDGIFDPPSPAKNHSPQRSQLPSLSNLSNINKNSGNNVAKSKKDLFDSLFDSSPVVKMNSKLRNLNKKSPDKRKKSGNSKIGVRMDENQLQILDDLPSSAVEMQVKDKFLKKLNRQERVVEEVKLVLKPHYTKKHITKEEYKDIMRKAVPKICHNKSGEINPKKIAQLVEAYVKRCRSSKRKLLPEAKPSATTTAATNKNLRLSKTSWS